MNTTPKDALEISFHNPETGRMTTYRDYFKDQLSSLFMGENPSGNKGQEHVLAGALILYGCIPGEINTDESDGEFIKVGLLDLGAYEIFIQQMIAEL